MVEHLTPQAG